MAEGMTQRNHAVTVLCYQDQIPSNLQPSSSQIRVIKLPTFATTYSQPLSLHWRGALKKWLPWADVIHLHLPHPLAEAQLLLANSQKPLIVTYHCDITRYPLLQKSVAPIAQRVLKRAKAIHVSSPKILNSLALEKWKHKCHVIPLGICEESFYPNSQRLLRAKTLKEKYGSYFLTVARIVSYKGHHRILQALQDIKTQRWCVIGEGPLKKQLMQQCRKLAITDKVHWLGKIPQEELPSYYYAAQATILPSDTSAEAYGLSLVESMYCGKAMITAKLNTGVTWLNRHQKTGITVDPQSPTQWKQAMLELSQNPSLCQAMGKAARLRYQNKLSSTSLFSKLENLYRRQLLNTQNSHHKEANL